MSTPYQYDPEKHNAWTRDLPPAKPNGPSFIIQANPYAMPQEAQAGLDKIVQQLVSARSIEAAARAVIAAGRPHGLCDCPACTAYDALASLLKDTP